MSVASYQVWASVPAPRVACDPVAVDAAANRSRMNIVGLHTMFI